jgi:thiamine biosynthesis lipoprotein
MTVPHLQANGNQLSLVSLSKIHLVFLLFTVVSWSQLQVFSFEGFAQGTTYHISYVADAKQERLPQQVDSLLACFDRSVSTYQPQSIISKVNRNEPVVLDEWFKHCFVAGKMMWQATDGAFDPTVYSLVNAWGFGPGRKAHIEQKRIDSLLVFVGMDKIKLHKNKIVKKDPRVALDFNAFAQGYSVDVVADFLKAKGHINILVEIGGEVIGFGQKPNGQCWSVGIEKPIDNPDGRNENQFEFKLCNKAMATSGNNRKFRIIDGVKYAHHIDPKTGYPAANPLLSASVLASNTLTADATATGLLVMGLEKAKTYLDKHPEIEALMVYGLPNGQTGVFATPGLKKILQLP